MGTLLTLFIYNILSNVHCTMVNGSSIVSERIKIAEERGISRGIREKGGNRLSADDSTIKANGSSDC